MFRKLTIRAQLPLLLIPVILVTGISLYSLLAAVLTSASASQPEDLLYPLHQPALQLQERLGVARSDNVALAPSTQPEESLTAGAEVLGPAATPLPSNDDLDNLVGDDHNTGSGDFGLAADDGISADADGNGNIDVDDSGDNDDVDDSGGNGTSSDDFGLADDDADDDIGDDDDGNDSADADGNDDIHNDDSGSIDDNEDDD
jgi:hypothetical protein